MKYIVLVGDGMSDYPVEELNGRTPLEVAKKPNIDEVAKRGLVGMAKTIPHGMEPASDVANMSILGYDPKKFYSGRGPLEAANIGVTLGADDVAFRCNLITVSKGNIEDYSAGHITNKETESLMAHLNDRLGSSSVKFYPGVSYRNLMVIKKGTDGGGGFSAKAVPPHNVMGQKAEKHYPRGEGSDVLIKLMEDSREVLEEHDINKVRVDLGENPANMIWLWGQGSKPSMPKFIDKFGVSGSVISAVDLVKGMGKLMGLDVVNVPGATGYYDTDYAAKGRYAIESLNDKDFVFVHVEAPDEAGHNGDLRAKIGAIENFDRLIVGAFLKHFGDRDDFRIMVLPDHATPVSIRTHVSDPIPFTICGKGIERDDATVFNETSAKSSGLKFSSGYALMDYFIKNKGK